MKTNAGDDLQLIQENWIVYLKVTLCKSNKPIVFELGDCGENVSNLLTRTTNATDWGVFTPDEPTITFLLSDSIEISCELQPINFDKLPKSAKEAEYLLAKLVSNINIVLFMVHGIEEDMEPKEPKQPIEPWSKVG